MKIRAVGVLAFINLVLLCGLALMWVKPDGTPRNIRWNEPAPLKADIAGLAPALMPDKQMESSRFLAMLERRRRLHRPSSPRLRQTTSALPV
jgi:hypothetical protein